MKLRCLWYAWQEDFLCRLSELRPDLCITAAYGNILPQAFLDIPRFGTLNIHPSLLPQYRGASPVQRALQVTCLSFHFLLCQYHLPSRTSGLLAVELLQVCCRHDACMHTECERSAQVHQALVFTLKHAHLPHRGRVRH